MNIEPNNQNLVKSFKSKKSTNQHLYNFVCHLLLLILLLFLQTCCRTDTCDASFFEGMF